MCRLIFYKGQPITIDLLTTRPDHSIIHQSYKSRMAREPLNGDGFGLSWYVPDISPRPAQYRSVQPAWNNVNLLHLSRVSRSHMILAHVRAATPGFGVSESNCHPFAADRFAFMHNGAIADFMKIKRKIRERLTDESYNWIHGTTDSEHAFALFRDQVAALENPDQTQRIADALNTTIKTIGEISASVNASGESFLNLVVADGERAVVARYCSGETEPHSCYFQTGQEYTCDNGKCHMHDRGGPVTSLIVASEPLNEDSGWTPIPPNHLLLIDPDFSLRMQAIE